MMKGMLYKVARDKYAAIQSFLRQRGIYSESEWLDLCDLALDQKGVTRRSRW
jgi:hypothetical protein